MSKLKVAVLMGGNSSERDISLWTGRQIVEALDPAKYTIYALDTATGRKLLDGSYAVGELTYRHGNELTPINSLIELPLADDNSKPDVVFIALHGPGGEDGTVQGMLEVLNLPYTGSKVLASALAMDKAMTKRVLTAGGIRMPADITLKGADDIRRSELRSITLPLVIKPNTQGSTIGMTVVRDLDDLDAALEKAFDLDNTVILEQFVEGVEISVPVLGNDILEVLPAVEILPKSGFYDYEAKYTAGATEEICPARLSAAVSEEAARLAQLSHELLGCRGMSRTDMIVDSAGRPWVLEVNTIPGMTPYSLLPLSAKVAGYSFAGLLDRIIELALEK